MMSHLPHYGHAGGPPHPLQQPHPPRYAPRPGSSHSHAPPFASYQQHQHQHSPYSHPYPPPSQVLQRSPPGSSNASRATSPGRPGSSGGPPAKEVPQGAGEAIAESKSKPRSRSSIACTNCRKSKMKCEGFVEGSSCRRCEQSKLPCLFEVGVGTKNRLAHAVGTTADGDDRRQSGSFGAPSASPRIGADLGPGYEKRLASLEAEMVNMRQLLATSSSIMHSSVAPSPRIPPTPQSISPSHGLRGHDSPRSQSHPFVHHSPPPNIQIPPHRAQSHSHGGWHPTSYAALSGSSASASPVFTLPGDDEAANSRRMTVSRSASLLLNPGPVPRGLGVSTGGWTLPGGAGKRPATGDAGVESSKKSRTDLDFIERGDIITEEEAQLCFDSYFATLNAPPSPHIPSIRLPFASVRASSPLLLAVLVAIGARAISHTTSYHLTLAEATRLAQLTFMSTAELSSWDSKAMMLLSLYTGQTGMCGHVRAAIEKTGCETALFRARDLGESKSGSEEARKLVLQGRSFLISWVWTELYTVSCLTAPVFHQHPDVLLEQLKVLRASPYSEPTLDSLIEIHVQSASYPHEAFVRLSPSMRAQPPSVHETLDVIGDIIDRLARWSDQTADMQGVFNGWGDGPDVRRSMPFYHTRMMLDQYVLRALSESDPKDWPAGAREHVRLATETAVICIRFGTESKAWLQHSSAAQYWFHVKLAPVLLSLYRCAQLLPQDINHPRMRKILPSLAQWLDRAITPLSTARESLVVEEMRSLSKTFTAFLDEQGSVPASTSPSSVMEPEPSTPNPDLQVSLESLRWDGVIWGCVLLEG